MWLWVCHCLSQFILKFQAFILIFWVIFKMENNFYTTTLSMTEILLATIYTAQFRWNGLRWKICLPCKLINKLYFSLAIGFIAFSIYSPWLSKKKSSLINPPLILVYLIFYVRVSLTQLTNLLCSSLTANRLSGNIPGHLGNFTALTYLYGLNLL